MKRVLTAAAATATVLLIATGGRGAAQVASTSLCTPPAPAGEKSGLITLFGGEQIVRLATGPVGVCGTVVLRFRGDPSTGCAQRALCGVSGETVWSPGSTAFMYLARVRRGSATAEEGSISFFEPFDGTSGLVTRVDRLSDDGSHHVCLDAQPAELTLSLTQAPGSQLRIVSPDPEYGDLAATRCTGPLDADLRGLLPTPSVAVADLGRGDVTIPLTADRTWSAAGLTGMLFSTLVIRTESLRTRPTGPQRTTGSAGARRLRLLTARYRVEQVTGQVAARIAGPSDPQACDVLDACGLSESVSLRPEAGGTLTLLARVPRALAGRPARDVLAHLRGGRVSGVFSPLAAGGGGLGRAARLAVRARRPGAAECDDAVNAGPGQVTIAVAHARAELSYIGVGGQDLLRSHCPGPFAGDFDGPLATGSIGMPALAARTTTIRLARPRTATSPDGFTIAAHPSLAITLRLLGVSERSESNTG